MENVLITYNESTIASHNLRELKKALYAYKILNLRYNQEAHNLYLLNLKKNLDIAHQKIPEESIMSLAEEKNIRSLGEKDNILAAPIKKGIVKMHYQLTSIKKILEACGFSFDKELHQPLYTKKNTNLYFCKPIYNTGKFLINVVNNKTYVELCPKALYKFNPSFNLMYNIIYEEKNLKPTKVSEITNINTLVAI